MSALSIMSEAVYSRIMVTQACQLSTEPH